MPWGFAEYNVINFARGNTPGSVIEVLTYLELKKGHHTFVITSTVEKADLNIDANFKVFAGTNPRDFFSKCLGQYKSNAINYIGNIDNDTRVDLFVDKDGIYPLQIVYYEMGSPNNTLKLSYLDKDDNKILVNDPNTKSINAFYNSSSLINTPYILSVNPLPNSTYHQGKPIEIVMNVDEGKTINELGISIIINDITVVPTINREKRLITLTINQTVTSGEVTVSLSYLDKNHAFIFTNDKPPIEVTGYWDFENKLEAKVGNDLEYLTAIDQQGTETTSADYTTFGKISDFPQVPPIVTGSGANSISHTDIKVMKVAGGSPGWADVANSSPFGYKMYHGIENGNGGGKYANEYTLIFDIFLTAGSAFSSLANFDRNGDGDVFISAGGLGQGVGGYGGKILYKFNEWNRVVLAFDLSRQYQPTYTDNPDNLPLPPPHPGTYEKYINGEYHSNQNNEGIDGRQAARNPFFLFQDNDGESGNFFVSAIQFRNGKLSADEIKKLGTVGTHIPIETIPSEETAYVATFPEPEPMFEPEPESEPEPMFEPEPESEPEPAS